MDGATGVRQEVCIKASSVNNFCCCSAVPLTHMMGMCLDPSPCQHRSALSKVTSDSKALAPSHGSKELSPFKPDLEQFPCTTSRAIISPGAVWPHLVPADPDLCDFVPTHTGSAAQSAPCCCHSHPPHCGAAPMPAESCWPSPSAWECCKREIK